MTDREAIIELTKLLKAHETAINTLSLQHYSLVQLFEKHHHPLVWTGEKYVEKVSGNCKYNKDECPDGYDVGVCCYKCGKFDWRKG